MKLGKMSRHRSKGFRGHLVRGQGHAATAIIMSRNELITYSRWWVQRSRSQKRSRAEAYWSTVRRPRQPYCCL